jgi:hypothetical protein
LDGRTTIEDQLDLMVEMPVEAQEDPGGVIHGSRWDGSTACGFHAPRG